jgi:hypothetical protein
MVSVHHVCFSKDSSWGYMEETEEAKIRISTDFILPPLCQKIVTSADNNGEVGGKMCLRQFRTLLYLTLHRLHRFHHRTIRDDEF